MQMTRFTFTGLILFSYVEITDDKHKPVPHDLILPMLRQGLIDLLIDYHQNFCIIANQY